MAAGKARTAIAASRFDAFWVEPEKLKLITDKDSPFYQTRAEDPPDDSLVRSMKAGGFLTNQAIFAFKNGETLVVIDGRRRTIAACQANRELKKEGREPLRVSVIVKKGTEAELYAIQCAANENRRDVSDVERAKEISKLMTYGKTVEEAGAVLGFNEAKAKRIYSLLDCAPAVLRAVEAGHLPTSGAVKLAKLERVEQVKQLEKMIKESGGERVRVTRTAKAVRESRGQVEVERPSHKVIGATLRRAESDEAAGDLRDVLRWVATGEARGAFGKWLTATPVEVLANPTPVLPDLPALPPLSGNESDTKLN